MIEPRTLKGFRDFLPQEARKRNYVLAKLKSVFESFGFEPLETPTLEYEEILAGKYGEEGEKLMYRFEDNGGRRVAMRYDQTVPLSRVVAQYQNELPIPFKRYQIQNVWRAENTQKGRYREFLQCDIDTIGSNSPLSDAEILAVAAKGYEALGFKNFRILINDRDVFNQLVNDPGQAIQENELPIVVRAIDKLKKIGKEKVTEEIIANGISQEKANYIMQTLVTQQPTQRIKAVMEAVTKLGVPTEQVEFLPTLARGMDYYTGIIIEVEIPEYTVGSVGGGGRYDNLIGMFTNQSFPAVGFAFGFDRTIEAMEALNLFPAEIADATAKVLVTIFSEETKEKSLEVTSQLRSNNINTEIYLGEVKEKNPLEKQLKYAIQKGIPYLIIIGPEETAEGVVNLKNLQTREQKKVSLEEAIKLLS